jgi:hypothetical protein
MSRQLEENRARRGWRKAELALLPVVSLFGAAPRPKRAWCDQCGSHGAFFRGQEVLRRQLCLANRSIASLPIDLYS